MYCSNVTANLVRLEIGVPEEMIVRIEMEKEFEIPDSFIDGSSKGNVKVTFMDADHCPGAVIILFVLPNGEKYFHTGDFRASDTVLERALKLGKIDKLYLDNTYWHSKDYNFPSQIEVINQTCKMIKSYVEKPRLKKLEKTLVIVGSYLIGKEKLAIGISKEFGWRISLDSRKRRIWEKLDWPELMQSLNPTEFDSKSYIFVASMGMLSNEGQLSEYINQNGFDSAIVVRGSGWNIKFSEADKETRLANGKRICWTVFNVPYSEHSSYDEIERFVAAVNAKEVICTVK